MNVTAQDCCYHRKDKIRVLPTATDVGAGAVVAADTDRNKAGPARYAFCFLVLVQLLLELADEHSIDLWTTTRELAPAVASCKGVVDAVWLLTCVLSAEQIAEWADPVKAVQEAFDAQLVHHWWCWWHIVEAVGAELQRDGRKLLLRLVLLCRRAGDCDSIGAGLPSATTAEHCSATGASTAAASSAHVSATSAMIPLL